MIKRWLSRLSITRKISLASLVWIALILGAFVGLFLPQVEELILAERRLFLRDRVDMVLNLLKNYQADIDSGALSLEEAQRRASRRLKNIISSKGEYFWILDSTHPSPKLIMHPIDPALEGTPLDGTVPGTANTVRLTHSSRPVHQYDISPLQAMYNICTAQGMGYLAYSWPKPAPGGGFTTTLAPKECYVALFKPWGWIIGTGEYMDDIKELVAKLRSATFVFLGLVTMLALMMAALLGTSIKRPLRRMMAATQSIAQGDLEARSRLASTSNEFEQLSRNFDEMASQLLLREQERDAAETARRDSEQKIRAVFENAFQLIWLLNTEGTLLDCNHSAMAFVEGMNGSLAGRPFWETPWWTDGADKVFQLHAALDAALHGDFVRFETSFLHPKDGLRIIDFSIKTACDADGKVLLLIPEGRDITETKMMERRLAHRNMHDTLTGLANRTLLTDRLLHALQVARRKPDTHQALLYIDINRFNIVNDSLGHLAGDAILREVAARIKGNVRETDTVARYGGDDFVVLLWELSSSREAIAIAKRIQTDLSAPIVLETQQVAISVSIGVDLLMDPARDPDDIVRNAHLAMSYTKTKRSGFLKVYTNSLLSKVRTSLVIESEMEKGIQEGAFFLQFQPIMDTTRDDRLSGFEALCRWRHPERGLIPPDEFIPVAEETGLIVPLGQWVLDTACANLAEMARRRPECTDVFVAVNLSSRQLERNGFARTVQDILERHELPPARLHLEVTERSLLSGSSSMIENILKLKKLGVHMVVDDFGVGYSNLAILTHIHFSAIKIDRSLIRQIQHMAESRAIIKAVVTMAESLGADVIVEGIETATQRDILKTIGCHMHQGFLYSRPVDFDVIAGLCCIME